MAPVKDYYAREWKSRSKLMARCCELGLEPVGKTDFLKLKLMEHEKKLAKIGHSPSASQGVLAVKPATQGPPPIVTKNKPPVSMHRKPAKNHKGYAVPTETWKEDTKIRNRANRILNNKERIATYRFFAKVAREASRTPKYLEYVKEENEKRPNSIQFTADSPPWSPITVRSISEAGDDDDEDPLAEAKKSAAADKFAAAFNAQNGT